MSKNNKKQTIKSVLLFIKKIFLSTSWYDCMREYLGKDQWFHWFGTIHALRKISEGNCTFYDHRLVEVRHSESTYIYIYI